MIILQNLSFCQISLGDDENLHKEQKSTYENKNTTADNLTLLVASKQRTKLVN